MDTKGHQICTECHEQTNLTVTDWWNSRQGQVISKDEKLCAKCASKRGFDGLSGINKSYEKQLQNGDE